MPRFSSKHKDVEKIFDFSNFSEGYTEETSPSFLSPTQLSECQNVKYVLSTNSTGEQKITVKKRQGTTVISNSALPSAADVLASTYYSSQSKYVLATATKLYYLDASEDPQEIGSSILDGVPTFTEFNGKLIIHDSGVTKFWDGDITSPVKDTNYGKIDKYIMNEILGTGNNSTIEFTGTLSNVPLTGSSLTISFTDTTAKTITDNGVGRLIGNVPGETSGVFETVDGAADNGAGLIRLTLNGHGFSDADEVNVAAVGGAPLSTNTYANPTWTVVGKTANTIDLTGSDSTGISYTSGGTVTTNAITNYATGTFVVTTDGAPDASTTVTADYYQKDGAPKSKAGLVRGSRLYTWGDGDNTSRLTYTEVNDETSTDTSSGGGYLDVDPTDGYSLLGGLNFETSLLIMKENSLHRIDSYPDDADFKVEKLTDDLGCIAHRTPLFEGDIVSFVSKEGWVAMHPSQRYGDIQKGVPISKNFSSNMAQYNNATAYTAFNPIDKQLWLALSTDGGTTYLSDIYVSNLQTGGQISRYKFKFSHTSFAYVDGKMLIGGADGMLYKLDDTNLVFTDNDVSYSDITYMTTGFADWGTTDNVKHNKKIFISVSGAGGVTFTLTFYRNSNFIEFLTMSIDAGSVWEKIYSVETKIFVTTGKIGQLIDDLEYRKKFNYKTVMVKFSNIAGNFGTEIRGIKFKSALIGDR